MTSSPAWAIAASLDRELPVVLEAANDLSLPVTLALIDVDHFKRVNDRFGHAVGDQVLVALAQMLREKTRASDLLARIGGEEFLVALPDTAPERAAEVCERLRLAVQNYAWDQLAGGLAVTLSVGVAHAPPYASQGALRARRRGDVPREAGRTQPRVVGLKAEDAA